jgi:hypothetical protein
MHLEIISFIHSPELPCRRRDESLILGFVGLFTVTQI